MPKTRITGFARLVIFLFIFVPLAYVGASLYNGEDPVANVKSMLGMNDSAVSDYDRESYGGGTTAPPATFENVDKLRADLDKSRRDVAILREELARCKAADVE